MRKELIDRYIECDLCGDRSISGITFSELEKELDHYGWQITTEKEICSECAELPPNLLVLNQFALEELNALRRMVHWSESSADPNVYTKEDFIVEIKLFLDKVDRGI